VLFIVVVDVVFGPNINTVDAADVVVDVLDRGGVLDRPTLVRFIIRLVGDCRGLKTIFSKEKKIRSKI